jgi:spermidine synthase
MSHNLHRLFLEKMQLNSKSLIPLVFFIFFVSGACALIYEVVWLKMLSLVFGVTALAAATTLASFMAGLGLGSYFFGKQADKSPRPLRFYGLLELGIAAFAFLMPLIMRDLNYFYIFLYRDLNSSYFWLSFTRLVLSFIILLFPTFLMGGTLPLIVKFVAHSSKELGSRVSQLYFFNTLGGVAGTAATGFFLLYYFGVAEAAYLAGSFNTLIAITAILMDKSMSRNNTQTISAAAPQDNIEEQDNGYSSMKRRLVLAAIGVSGFCSLAYEVLWTRALIYILDNTAHAFTTMLTAFLIGIAAGSIIVSRFLDKAKHQVLIFAAVEAGIAFFAILSIPVFGNLGANLGISGTGIFYPTENQFIWGIIRFGRSLSVMLVPTVLMGMSIPLAVRIYTKNFFSTGKSVGRVFAVNTAGGVAGSFAGVLLLMPLLGVYRSVIAISLINLFIALGLILSVNFKKYLNKLKMVLISSVPYIAAIAVLLSQGQIVFASTVELALPHEVLFYGEGAAATVKVYQDVFGARTLSIDGFPVAGTTARHLDAQKSLGHFPFLISQVDKPGINIIGFGAGGSSWTATLYKADPIDVVELIPDVIEAAELIPEVNHDVMHNPYVDIILNDGRNYVMLSQLKYDIISVDATSPKSAGSGSLYSLEFYESCLDSLSEEGTMVQWLPYHLMTEPDVKMVIRTYQTVFPHTSLWFSFERNYYLLVGTKTELQLNLEQLQNYFADSAIQEELQPLDINDPYDFLACFLMGEESLKLYAGDSRLNTDDHPRLEYDPSTTYLNIDDHVRQNLNSTRLLRENVFPYIVNFNGITMQTAQQILNERIANTPIERFWPQYIDQ